DQNRAAMSGLVRDANVTGYVGLRILLTVEDGGEGQNAEPDKFTWGAYGSNRINWTPADADLKDDDGWSPTWIANDFDGPDDRGVPITRDNEVNCRAFPLSVYTLIDLPQGSGNIQVRP